MEEVECSSHRLLVADLEGEIVGWCRSFPSSCEEAPLHAELGIGLLTKYRNQGFGTELVLRSLRWAETAGLRRVDLTVSLENAMAIHVFRKCGFETAQIHDHDMMMSIFLS
jgi:RimJ/RimL family protein N-acetyltransferase